MTRVYVHAAVGASAVLGLLQIAYAKQHAAISQRSDRVEIVQSWAREIFRDEPVTVRLPITVPYENGETWFSLEQLKNSSFLHAHPNEKQTVWVAIDKAQTVRKAEIDSMSLLDPNTTLSAIAWQKARPMVFINPPVLKHNGDLEEVVANSDAPDVIAADVLKLVNNRLYKTDPDAQNNTTLPSLMGDLLNEDFDALKAGISPDKANKLKNCHLTYAVPVGQKQLWMGTEQRESSNKGECPYIVTISPLLVRAVFASNLGRMHPWMNLTASPERDYLSDFLLTSFKNDFYFLIAHEMGHMFYDRWTGLNNEDEKCIDWEAKQVMTRAGLHATSQSGFFKVLVMAVHQNEGELWSLESSSSNENILDRFSHMDDRTMPAGCAFHFSQK